MRTLQKLVFLLLVVATSACEREAPLLDIDGKAVDTAGQILLVNYWAEWCAPCREEVPELNHLDAQRKDVTVVGFNYDAPEVDKNRAQMAALGIEFPVLATDPATIWAQPRPQVLPTTFIIGSDGLWKATLVGPQTEASLSKAIDAAVQ